MLSTENNVRIKTLSLQRSIIPSGRGNRLFRKREGIFYVRQLTKVREYAILAHRPLATL